MNTPPQIDWLKNLRVITVSTNKQIKRKNPVNIITLSSWQRRCFNKDSPEHNVIDYFTNFSTN